MYLLSLLNACVIILLDILVCAYSIVHSLCCFYFSITKFFHGSSLNVSFYKVSLNLMVDGDFLSAGVSFSLKVSCTVVSSLDIEFFCVCVCVRVL